MIDEQLDHVHQEDDLWRKLLNFRTSAFLLLCFVLGGTSQAVVEPKLGIYLVSIFTIALVLWRVSVFEIFAKSKALVIMFGGFITYSMVQLFPLPPGLWTHLPGHADVAEGFQTLNIALPWLPISLTPEKTLSSLFDFLPPVAVFLLASHVASKREREFAIWTISLFAIGTVILGVLQMSVQDNALHFYEVTNKDLPVGFFSNGNHQATFLLMALAFSFLLFSATFKAHGSNRKIKSAPHLVLTAMTIFGLIVGLVLNTSVAGYLLMVLVVLMSALFVLMKGRLQFTKLHVIILLAVTPFAGFLIWDLLFLSSTMQGLMKNVSSAGDMSRLQVFAKTIETIPAYFPFGSGLGSYADVYRLYEDKQVITNVFSPHTHNDYLEILLEYGVVGMLLIAGFFIWWGLSFISLIRSHRRSGTAGIAASIAIFAVLLHSIVDYPMRTIAICAVFAFCLSLINNSLKRG